MMYKLKFLYCGVCHSDLHTARNEWGGTLYPCVTGHEIVGRVTAVGEHVTKFKVGELAGIGCLVDSCRECDNCKDGLEQYCSNGMVGTYNGQEKDGQRLYTWRLQQIYFSTRRFCVAHL
ncbi:MAG: alcohol dehydrogenase catalytic domain-containing protein [Ferruginibacter sp.]